jgi:hypothetical protein
MVFSNSKPLKICTLLIRGSQIISLFALEVIKTEIRSLYPNLHNVLWYSSVYKLYNLT